MDDQAKASNSSGKFWALVPVLLLGSMLVGLGTAAYVAIDDPHFALEPNYYDKAVHWDQAQADSRKSAALGLQLTLAPLSADVAGKVRVELTALDRASAPLEGAVVELDAFPNAFASHVQHVTLRETRPGVYSGELVRSVPGLWELRLSVKRGADTFRQVLRRDVARGGAA
jgi:nitrogen fixation protein FixH